jgi:NAD(P)-dependent dehydrogenase (short-subunit alcohol dehydrogenase family)
MAYITGGSTSIGEAISKKFAREGATKRSRKKQSHFFRPARKFPLPGLDAAIA